MPAVFNPTSSRSSNGYRLQLQNLSYPVGSAFAQQYPKCMGQPFNSQSMDFQTRNSNSLTTTKGLLSPYNNNNRSLVLTSMGLPSVQQQWQMNASQQPFPQPTLPSPFLTSKGSSSVQQQQGMNASQQPLPQPTQQDFVRTPDRCSGQSPLTPTYCPSPIRPPSFPLMNQSPNASPAPSNCTSPLSTYSRSNVGQQDDRPFKCDQCPQSFNRNHDLKRHKRIHLAVKPFPCGHCEKSFSRKDALKVRSSFDLICRLEQGDS
jgi:uncharacterized Zn-finger protein